MAKEGLTQQQNVPQTEAQQQPVAPEKPSVKKMLLIGVPLFLIQVVVVYFLVVKFFTPGTTNTGGTPNSSPGMEQAVVSEGSSSSENIYIIKDIIINPAGTNGNRYLLATVGLEASNKATWAELTQKEVQVRDVLNTILTSKTLLELVDVTKREALRTEIAKKTTALLKNGVVKNVYFSKYIIQ